MKTEKLFAVLIASAVLQTMIVSGQEDVFNVSFTGSARPGTGNRDVSKLNNRALIEQCVGTGSTAKEISQNFALVYNATEDTIQVVNRADGSVVCDLFHFEGGTSTVQNNHLVRLAFVFSHDQPDSIGSAVINEKANNTTGKNASAKPHVSGKLQFTQPATTQVATDTSGTTVTDVPTSDVTNSDGTVTTSGEFIQANAVASTTTDQQVCQGTFTVGRAFVVGVPATKSSKKKNKNNNTNTSTDTTTTDNTTTGTTDQSSTTDQTSNTSASSQTSTNSTQTSTNSLGGMNTSILTLFPGNLTTNH